MGFGFDFGFGFGLFGVMFTLMFILVFGIFCDNSAVFGMCKVFTNVAAL